jgi:hypothetical protein
LGKDWKDAESGKGRPGPAGRGCFACFYGCGRMVIVIINKSYGKYNLASYVLRRAIAIINNIGSSALSFEPFYSGLVNKKNH